MNTTISFHTQHAAPAHHARRRESEYLPFAERLVTRRLTSRTVRTRPVRPHASTAKWSLAA